MWDLKINEVISLPRDTSPHSTSNLEWWYFFAFLREQGKNEVQYAVMGSFFRAGEFPLRKGHYLIFSLIDLKNKRHHGYSFIDQKLVQQFVLFLPYYLLKRPSNHPMRKLLQLLKSGLPFPHRWMSQVTIDKQPTTLQYGNHSLSFFGEQEDHFNVHLQTDAGMIDLQFQPTKPLALIGGNGKPDRLYYYSFTNNEVSGILPSISFPSGIRVEGKGWFDHQWGKATLEEIGWDWFGLKLDDGREIMINRFHSDSTGKPMVNLINKDGTVYFTRDVQLQPGTRTWKSLRTDAKYPLEWKIIIPKQQNFQQMEVHVNAIFNQQEMQILGPIQGIWEGACTVLVKETLADHSVKSTTGLGFMELVGYASQT